MPVGTVRARSRIDIGSGSATSGVSACAEAATGTTASEMTTAAIA